MISEKTLLKRKQKVQQFIEANNQSFIYDFITSSYDDIIKKYHISYEFCKVIEAELCLQKDYSQITRKKAERLRNSLLAHGNEKRKKTCLERYGVESVFSLDRIKSAAKNKRHKESPRPNLLNHCMMSKKPEPITLADVWYNSTYNHTITAEQLLFYGAEKLIKTDTKIFDVGKTAEEFILKGGRKEYAKECAMHSDNPLWFPTNIDILEHYGYVRTISTNQSDLYVDKSNTEC